MKKQVVAIVGVGMMGGSLGLAIKKRRAPYYAVGIGRKIARLLAAKKMGVCDEVADDFKEGIPKADIVVLCTPVHEIVPYLKKILPYLKPNAVVTDIGSVKSSIVDDVKKTLHSHPSSRISRPIFIGGHPLCGSEKTGWEYAQKDLYKNAVVVLTPSSAVPADDSRNRRNAGPHSSLNKIKKLWNSVGAQTLVMDPQMHDWLVAGTSHLPHFLASALTISVANLQKKNPDASKLLAGSFRDMTRIADSDSFQWAQISSANQKFLIEAAQSCRKIMDDMMMRAKKSKHSAKVWESFYSSAKKSRAKLLF